MIKKSEIFSILTNQHRVHGFIHCMSLCYLKAWNPKLKVPATLGLRVTRHGSAGLEPDKFTAASNRGLVLMCC